MLKQNYYYIVAGLPELFFDENKTIESSADFKNEIKELLSPADFECVELLFLARKNRELLDTYFKKGEVYFDELPPELSNKTYIRNFVEWAEGKEVQTMKLEFENKLYSLYYNYVLSVTSNDFLKNWFKLELDVKNILTAINCEKFHYLLPNHLIKTEFNKASYSLLVKKQFKYELYEDLIPVAKQVFAAAEANTSVVVREQKIDKILWNYVEEETTYNYFTIEKILTHIIKLYIVERWSPLNETEGKTFLAKLIADIKQTYNLADAL